MFNDVQEYVPADKLAEVWRVLYGNNDGAALQSVNLTTTAAARAASSNFDLKHYSFVAAPEQLRAPRVVRAGLIQHSIVLPTTDPYPHQRQVCAYNALQLYIIQCGPIFSQFEAFGSKNLTANEICCFCGW